MNFSHVVKEGFQKVRTTFVSAETDPVDMLKEQHRAVEALFKQISESESALELGYLREQLACVLGAHMVIEEEVFYPAAQRIKGQEGRVFEAQEEHELARRQLDRLMSTSPSDSKAFQARAKVLKELIEHHVKEEENQMFPLVNKAWDKAFKTALGANMEAIYQQTLAQSLSSNHGSVRTRNHNAKGTLAAR